MIPLNIISKLVRSRSQVTLATKTIVTSGALWKEKKVGQKGSDTKPEGGTKQLKQNSGPIDNGSKNLGEKSKETYDKQAKQSDTKPEEGTKQLKQSCGPRDKGSKSLGEKSKETYNKQAKGSSCPPSGEQDYMEKRKQGEGSSCGPIQTYDSESKEKLDATRKQKPSVGGTLRNSKERYGGQSQKPGGCSCPPYASPKQSGEKESKKSSCGEQDVSQKQGKYEPEQKRADPCKGRESSRKEDNYGAQQKKDPCKTSSSKKKGVCAGEDTKRSSYCGPVESSYKSACKEERGKSEYEDPCRSKKSYKAQDDCKEEIDPLELMGTGDRCIKQEKDCDDPCRSSKTSCPGECEDDKRLSLDPCKTKEEICPEDTCLDKQENDCCQDPCQKKENDCPPDPCKKEIEIPKLAPCCEINAAKDCICKLKQLQMEWEKVIAAHECAKEDDCKPQDDCKPKDDCAPKCGDSATRDKRSNMTYVVLSAIMVAVLYYIYNGDFEPDHLFLEEEEEAKEGDKDEDE